MILSFRDLEVYQDSYQLALQVYAAVKAYPQEERYGLTSQIQRAAVSIPANLAEGFGKKESAAEFRRYVRMAMGSSNEIEVLLSISRDLGYLRENEARELIDKYIVVQKKLYNLAQRWE